MCLTVRSDLFPGRQVVNLGQLGHGGVDRRMTGGRVVTRTAGRVVAGSVVIRTVVIRTVVISTVVISTVVIGRGVAGRIGAGRGTAVLGAVGRHAVIARSLASLVRGSGRGGKRRPGHRRARRPGHRRTGRSGRGALTGAEAAHASVPRTRGVRFVAVDRLAGALADTVDVATAPPLPRPAFAA